MERTEWVPAQGGSDRTEIVNLQPGSSAAAAVSPFVLECIPGRRYALSSSPSREHVLFQARAGTTAVSRRMPLNLSLVIDRSGSMDGEPLDYVKRACQYVVDLLEPTDILSIVTFETEAEVLMPARRVVNRQLIKDHILRIEPGNTTNLYDGLSTGYRQVQSALVPGYLSRVLLLTDGDPTAGIKDFSTIVGRVTEAKGTGISTTALGFGPDYNEELLAGIARRSGGNYYFIDRPDRIPDIFRKEMDQMMNVVAKNLRLRLRLSKWVQLQQAYGMQVLPMDRQAEVTLPDLDQTGVVNALIELQFQPRPPGAYRVLEASLLADTDVSHEIKTRAIFEFTADANLVANSANPMVSAEIAVFQAARNMEKTMMGMRTQQINIAAATNELQRTQQILIQSGRSDEAVEVTQAINALSQQDSNTAEKTIIGTIYNLDIGRRRG